MIELLPKDKVLEILNDLGGCGAEEKYFQGWDAAIDGAYEAINELEPIDYNPEEIKELKNENVCLKKIVDDQQETIGRLRNQMQLFKLVAELDSEE